MQFTIYRYYFQLLATEVLIAKGFYGIISHFGWKRVSIIAQDENLFTAVRIYVAIFASICALCEMNIINVAASILRICVDQSKCIKRMFSFHILVYTHCLFGIIFYSLSICHNYSFHTLVFIL